MKNINKEPLTIEERAWTVDLLGHPSYSFWSNPTKKQNLSSWKIRMSNEDFQNWWAKIGISALFFYGASKGNPQLASVGGVIYDPMGNKQKEYAWGIRREMNNGAEWIALIKGSELAKDIGIEEMSVIGDSLIVIREAIRITRNQKSPTSKMHHLLLYLGKEFKSISFLHVLRVQNHQADRMENKGVGLRYRVLEKDKDILENIWIP